MSSRGIFLSYRRQDAAPYARLLQFQLRERLPGIDVFMDLDSIAPGLEFAEVIREALDSCAVLVVLIGRQWATVTDEQGRRRLDDPDDFVRFEVQAALERRVRVIPVLVDGARPPGHGQLPAGLDKLARLNVLELSYDRYEYDANRLLDEIQRVLAAASSTGIAPDPSSATSTEALVVPDNIGPGRNTVGQAAQKDPEVVRKDRARTIRVLIDAKTTAESISDESSKARAFASIARVLAATDPDRAARLLADAERAAQSISDDGSKARALTAIATALAATDPDRAERIAQSISDEYRKADLLAAVARGLAATDPDRGARLLADAERAAQSIPREGGKAIVLAAVARALAATHPDRAARLLADAERAAQSISRKGSKARALTAIATALAATDPDRAERIAQSISDEYRKAEALVAIAEA